MREFSKSVVFGLLTISIWILASMELKTSKQIQKDFVIIENDKNIEDSLLETLTIDYEDTAN